MGRRGNQVARATVLACRVVGYPFRECYGMTRRQINKATGTAAMPDLWHFGPGGTLGANLGANLYDLAAQVDTPQREACERCGQWAAGALCDDCLDAGSMPEATFRNCNGATGG